MKRFFVLACSALIGACSVLGACGKPQKGPGNGGVTLDKKKYQLYVANYNGGIGSEWFDAAVARFEAAHATDTFSNGKTGVQIMPTKNKTHYAENIQLTNFDVVIDQDVKYVDLASKGALVSLSDVVTDTTNGRSIESRMTERQKSALTTNGGEYYVVPHYEYFGGLSYDINTFKDYRLYFADNANNGNDGFIIRATDKKSVGPDGIADTYDDGLPRTYDEFFKLMDRMVAKGVTPFVWTGQYKYYIHGLLFGLLSAYCGAEELETAVTFNSGEKTVRVIDGFDGNVPQTREVTVTKANGYETTALAGRYYALSFLEKILSNEEYYHSRSLLGISDVDAQKLFVDGYCKAAEGEVEPIGFLVEGNYWYNASKASGHFKSIEKLGYTEAEREVGWMPLPGVVSDDESNKVTKTTLMNQADCFMMINGNIKNDKEKVDLAKEFIRFLNTEESLQEFTVITGNTKALDYDLTEAQYNSMGNYAKSFWDIRKNADRVYMYDGNDLFINNQKDFVVINGGTFWQTSAGGSQTSLVLDKLNGKVNAKEYFLGMKVTQNAWNNMYGEWID